MNARPMHARLIAILVVTTLSLAAGACTGTESGGSASVAPVASQGPATSPTVPIASPPTSPADTPPVPGGPPAASMAIDGGDPVEGELGTFTWGEGGSDSGWLQGSPIDVGAGETLAVTFDPAVPVESWTARYTRLGAADPSGATTLARGHGAPVFDPPPVGAWTVELRTTFADAAGEAAYAWAVTVR